jgi:hypothetical protein
MKLTARPVRAGDRQPHPDQAAIFERLEATKRYGLVSDYFVSFTRGADRFSAKVTVWRRQDTPSDVVQNYVSRLLNGLVPDRQIVIAD